MSTFRFSVYRSTRMGGQSTGPTRIATFMNQIDAEVFGRAETDRATRANEDVSILVKQAREEVCLYHSATARDRLGIGRIDTRPVTYRQLVQRIQEILPGHQFDTDNEGQLVIYTGCQQTGPDDAYLTFDDALAGT